jgi:hypothetical protein
MGSFFDSKQTYKYRDPYEYFNKHFGAPTAGLNEYFTKRLSGNDPYSSTAYGLQSGTINRAFNQSRGNLARALSQRGQTRGPAGIRAMADLEAQRARALSDAISKIVLQRESQLPAMAGNFLANMKMRPLLEGVTKEASGYDKVKGGMDLVSKGVGLVGQIGTGASGLASLFGGAGVDASQLGGMSSDAIYEALMAMFDR